MKKFLKWLSALFALALISIGGWLYSVQFGPVMKPRSVGEFSIWLGEHWVWEGNDKVEFPWGVKWGFYPVGGNPDAITCAEKSYSELVAFLESKPADFSRLVGQGASNRIALWVNDYTSAPPDRKERPASMWHWSSGAPGDLTSGFWKWETTLTRSGECLTPSIEAAELTLAGSTVSTDAKTQ